MYKGKPFAKAEPYQYGIYSIKQRELHKTSNGNGGKFLLIFIWKKSSAIMNHTFYLSIENTNGQTQTTKLRDRVQNISQKVDTMKLNDSNGTTKTVATISHREFLHRDENKNTTPTAAASATAITVNSVGVSTRRKLAATAADIDNNNDNFDKTVTNPTQGDTLNQIKAMRRRHTRLSCNITPVSGL